MCSSVDNACDRSRRVLILAPSEGDAHAISHVLAVAGFLPRVCGDITDVAREFAREDGRGAAAVIITEEALLPVELAEPRRLADTLAAQPSWSDLPVILLSGGSGGREESAWEIARTLDPLGNITILERPLKRTTLLSAVAVAIRARERQYQQRDTLAELANHRAHLQELVERKTAELAASTASLHSAERLASLGTLAAGLGHDIANLALPIRSRLDSLRLIAGSADALVDIDAIDQALAHLSHVSAGMRLMALDPNREESSAPALDLREWVAESLPVLRAALPRHVHLGCTIAPGLGVSVPRHRLTQALFNLVQNAGEAMIARTDGRVEIVADAAECAGAPIVRLVVSDNGPGMTPAVLSRCFEPYFSTKGRAISTGMGLALVKGIAESAGGKIAVESTPGAGTTFTITFPLAAAERAPRAGSLGTGAVTISDARMSSLVCMLIEQLDLKSARHAGRDPPIARVWVIDQPDRDRITGFLDGDPDRRVVALVGSETSASQGPSATDPPFDPRIFRLPRSPSPSQLRNALLSCCAR